MYMNAKNWWQNLPSKGGLLGALIGALTSARVHHPNDGPLKNAGKTAVFAGAGYMLGQWIEKALHRKS
jgi:phage tail tape-measure protein